MPSKNSCLTLASVAVLVVLSGPATTGPALAATQPTVAAASTSSQVHASAVPTGFVDLAARPLPADGERHEFTVTYRNDATADRTVAPQLLVVSPDAGPFLAPSDITLERRTADGRWEAVRVGTQTGTLFTDLSAARRVLHAGETLTEVYRLTVVGPQATGTVQPRVALFG
ncbi:MULTISPECIES: hypothetical protein [unclassified Streptomyces]|uniref:hypothetical protein n=1 Tax=unclassified Streptomyces TaxID=2593676 RepID=UPI00225A7879|nr:MULTISPECIES: hypothetical protein [unclassified Streptomyces]MCX5055551.1 signal peptide protein [Streptomyces sp. NBC_00452]